MATTLRTELTKAGCNVTTATIVFQSPVGIPRAVGSPSSTSTNLNGQSTTGGTDARLDARFIQRQDSASVPRCIAIDSTYIYVWVATVSKVKPGFVRIPITATSYTSGNLPIPIIADS